MIGDLETARRKFSESSEVAKKMGNKRLVYSSRSEFAHALREHGELDEPLAIYKDLLPKWRELGHRAAVAHELECIAYILGKKGQTHRAVKLLGAAEVLREAIDTSMTQVERLEYEQEISSLRERMGETEFKQAWSDGRSMTMEDAIQWAIEI
jgi:hypothetical protein